MEKQAGAYRTIGEAAEELDLPQHVLRFWETRFSQISPMKRSGGRRYYRPDDLELLAAIRHLLYGEGYTIKGVQRILKQQGVHAVVDLVNQLKDGSATSVAAATAANALSGEADPAQAGNVPAAPQAGSAAEGRPLSVKAIVPEDNAPASGGGGQTQRLAGDTANKLRAVLSELEACARVLETARSS